MKLQEVEQQLQEIFTMPLAEDFDNVGLLCGNPENEISGILVCHDALEIVVDEAISKNINLIVTFHPIIFSGLKSITGKNYVEKALLKAIENKIAIYAIHTAFDNDYFGVNYRICEKLGLQNQQVLMPKQGQLKQLSVYVPQTYSDHVKEALFEAGAGKIGFYDECSFTVKGTGSFRPQKGSQPFLGETNQRELVEEDLITVVFQDHQLPAILTAMRSAHPYEEVAHQIYSVDNQNPYAGLGRFGDFSEPMHEKDFLQFVKDQFNLSVIRHSQFNGKKIKRVGVLGGSGASGIKAAIRSKCDAYLTGDIKYHEFFQHENKMLICDIGHFESEQFVVEQLFEALSEKFTKFAVLKSAEKTNPVNYFI